MKKIQIKRNIFNVKTHGMSCEKIYSLWKSMRQRCFNINSPSYHNYGGRGITICKRWQGDKGFQNFLTDMGKRPDGTSIDRIDNNKNYSPRNCKWATNLEQCRNQRKNIIYKGECATDASLRLGGNRNLISNRMTLRNWSKEKAFTTPIKKKI